MKWALNTPTTLLIGANGVISSYSKIVKCCKIAIIVFGFTINMPFVDGSKIECMLSCKTIISHVLATIYSIKNPHLSSIGPEFNKHVLHSFMLISCSFFFFICPMHFERNLLASLHKKPHQRIIISCKFIRRMQRMFE